jgi:hypothetical protein
MVAGTPLVSVRTPRGVTPDVMPLMVAVPLYVMSPVTGAAGPVLGRTLMPDQVSLLAVPELEGAHTSIVIVPAATLADADDDPPPAQPPGAAIFVAFVVAGDTDTFTVAATENSKAAGASRMMVPAMISATAPSWTAGPVRVAYTPVPGSVPAVSADIVAEA